MLETPSSIRLFIFIVLFSLLLVTGAAIQDATTIPLSIDPEVKSTTPQTLASPAKIPKKYEIVDFADEEKTSTEGIDSTTESQGFQDIRRMYKILNDFKQAQYDEEWYRFEYWYIIPICSAFLLVGAVIYITIKMMHRKIGTEVIPSNVTSGASTTTLRRLESGADLRRRRSPTGATGDESGYPENSRSWREGREVREEHPARIELSCMACY